MFRKMEQPIYYKKNKKHTKQEHYQKNIAYFFIRVNFQGCAIQHTKTRSAQQQQKCHVTYVETFHFCQVSGPKSHLIRFRFLLLLLYRIGSEDSEFRLDHKIQLCVFTLKTFEFFVNECKVCFFNSILDRNACSPGSTLGSSDLHAV